MTTIPTLFSFVLTPVLFAFWASMNPATLVVLQNISMDPLRVLMTFLIMLVIPVTAGMLLLAKCPGS